MNTPTEPGWYWVRLPNEESDLDEKWDRWQVAEVWRTDSGLLLMYSLPRQRPAEQVGCDEQWGPRVPPPEALLTPEEEVYEHEIAKLIDEEDFDLARTKLEKMREKICERTGDINHPRLTYLGTCISVMEA